MRDIHSKKFSPSASNRWIHCPGSVALCEKLPKSKETGFALEGSAAHTLAETCINTGQNALAMLNMEVDAKGTKFVVDEDMADAVQVYLDKVNSLINEDTVHGVEVKFNLALIHKELFGTSDCYIYNRKEKVLYVLDYKHGKGIEVFPENNSQMQIYAIGALHDVYGNYMKVNSRIQFDGIKKVVLIIVQPRIFRGAKIKEWVTSAEDLKLWSAWTLRPAIETALTEHAPCIPGDHCRFCPVSEHSICSAQTRTVMRIAKTGFDRPVLQDPESMTPKYLSQVLNTSEVIAMWAKNVHNFAQNRLRQGGSIIGRKLVVKSTNRKWRNESIAALELDMYLKGGAYIKKLLSIAQAEKALKGKGYDAKECLHGLWEKPEGEIVMAHESDKRRAVLPAVSEFIKDLDIFQ